MCACVYMLILFVVIIWLKVGVQKHLAGRLSVLCIFFERAKPWGSLLGLAACMVLVSLVLVLLVHSFFLCSLAQGYSDKRSRLVLLSFVRLFTVSNDTDYGFHGFTGF